MNWLATIAYSAILIVLTELLLRLPLREQVSVAARVASRAQHTMMARRISDHWKERALLAYAGKLFRNTLSLAVTLGLFFGIAATLILLADVAGVVERNFIFGWKGIAYSIVFATLYASTRKRFAHR